MKNFSLLLLSSLLFTIFISCSNDSKVIDSESLKSTKQNVDFSKIDFSSLELNIDLNNVEPIKKRFSKDLSAKDKLTHIALAIQKLNNKIEYRINNDESTSFIEYSIKVRRDSYTINNWHFIPSKPNVAAKGPYEEPAGWDCPEGQTLVDVCWSRDCVEKALSTVIGPISSGDTVQLTVHHGGAFGGVSICSN